MSVITVCLETAAARKAAEEAEKKAAEEAAAAKKKAEEGMRILPDDGLHSIFAPHSSHFFDMWV